MIDLKNEEWKLITNSTYAISSHGRVKRIAHKKFHNVNKTYYWSKDILLKSNNQNAKKYWRIRIKYLDGTSITESVHRLVAKEFVPNPDNKPQVNHIDGNKDNNHYSNQEWVTNEENMAHRYTVLKSFNHRKGSACNFSKLKEENIYEIKKLIDNKIPMTIIAKQFGVGHTTICEIKAGRSWSHLGLFKYKQRKSEKYNKEELGLRFSPTTTEK